MIVAAMHKRRSQKNKLGDDERRVNSYCLWSVNDLNLKTVRDGLPQILLRINKKLIQHVIDKQTNSKINVVKHIS